MGIVGYTFHAGDLFHVGHLHQLLECHNHCDYLIVGLLTDQAIASYKRLPIIPYPWRVAIYRELNCVDQIVPQDSRDPTDNLKNLKPDILFHGSDWDKIPGADWMEANDKRIMVTSYFYGISTSIIIDRCRNDWTYSQKKWKALVGETILSKKDWQYYRETRL